MSLLISISLVLISSPFCASNEVEGGGDESDF